MTRAEIFDQALAKLVAEMPVRAATFIVTLYGDAIVPRGGEVWIGTIIETCAAVGISETLVRTAVSRLVSAGQLEGWRRGRRSYYRLTEQAQAEFERASELIYGPPQPWRWRFVYLSDAQAEAQMPWLERQGFARLRANLAVGPDWVDLPRSVLSFDAAPKGDLAILPEFAMAAWSLETHAAAYRSLIAQFEPVLAVAQHASPREALIARLLLVHAWRGVLLRDPRLPDAALPADWPGRQARALFAKLYVRLSAGADSYAGDVFEGAQGPLPASNSETQARLTLLAETKTVRDQQVFRSDECVTSAM